MVFLTEERGRLVEKHELIDAVWRDAFVTENVLSRAVAQLRRALGEDAKDVRYIETVPTRGYRFIAGVEVETDGNGQHWAEVPAVVADRQSRRVSKEHWFPRLAQ